MQLILNDIILLVQKNKRLAPTMPIHAPAQLVAEAVVAFNKNNLQREAAENPPLAQEVGHFVSSLTF